MLGEKKVADAAGTYTIKSTKVKKALRELATQVRDFFTKRQQEVEQEIEKKHCDIFSQNQISARIVQSFSVQVIFPW